MINTTQNPTLAELKISIKQAAYSLKQLLESKIITKPYNHWIVDENVKKVDKCQIELYDLNSDENYPVFEEMPNGYLYFQLFFSFYTGIYEDNGRIVCPTEDLIFTYNVKIAIRYNNEFLPEFKFFNVEDNAIDKTSNWQNDMNTFVDSILAKMKDEISLNVSFESKPFNGFLID